MSDLFFDSQARNTVDAIDTKWDPHKDSLFYVIDRNTGGIVSKYKVNISRACSSIFVG